MAFVVVTPLPFVGCAADGGGDGPRMMSATMTDPWTFRGITAQKIRTAHYLIYTTVKDAKTLAQLPQLMEGAYRQYRLLAPDVPDPADSADASSPPPSLTAADRPMECYIFSSRREWDAFTADNTGKDAKIYLQIRKGGYTVGDRYVAYDIGPFGTASVAAHEGWHQFVARHFKGRLPPFLEEGMACMFEGVNWSGDLPRWNLAINQVRAAELRKTVRGGKPWPLGALVRMHAGEVVDLPGERIEAFYAQSWAFARFLWEAEGGRYRSALRRWIADTAAGEVYDPTHSHSRLSNPWNPDAVQPILEHYLGMSLAEIDWAYRRYIDRIIESHFDESWKE